MHLTYQFLLKPTRGQRRRLVQILEMQRLLYNGALDERISAYRKRGLSISKFAQQKSLKEIQDHDPEGYGALASRLNRWTICRLDDAFQNFFSRVRKGQTPGFPRFKPIGRWSSFGFAEWNGIRLKKDRLCFVGMDRPLRVNWHRQMPVGAVPKSATFTLKGKRWFVSIAVQLPDSPEIDRTKLEAEAVGIDVGINKYAALSSGEFHENPRLGRKRRQALARAQQALARCKRGSNRRRKVKARLLRIYERLANARKTHAHTVGASVVGQHRLVFVEGLKIRNMTRSAAGTIEEPGSNVRQKAGLNREFLDVAPGRLIQLLTYKAARAGGAVIAVDPRNTSRECSACGKRDPGALGPVVYRCSCGHTQNRDVNAAINIRNRGLTAWRELSPAGEPSGPKPVAEAGNDLAPEPLPEAA